VRVFRTWAAGAPPRPTMREVGIDGFLLPMPSKIAVLSDIHGVLPALEAVLAEPDVAGADHIVALGDVAAGPQPCEVLDLLLRLGPRVSCVSGNADRELVAFRRDGRALHEPIDSWAAQQLREDHLDWLSGLPLSVTMSIDGLGVVYFCHATPRSDEEIILVDSRLARWNEVFGELSSVCRTVVCGHTHMPFARLAGGRMVINPGSVGMPYGRPGAHWALLGPGVELRRTEFDLDWACARTVEESNYPGIAEWAEYFIKARATDAEALGAFGPRDGR
jgi:predicted phosphodiesterase